MNQFDLVTGFLKVIGKQQKCVKPRVINTVIECANKIISEIERPDIVATPGMGLSAWLKCDDTGLSSRFMAHVLSGGPPAENRHPLDADDFGRCYRFLRAVCAPGSGKEKVAGMASCSLQWHALVGVWADLEQIYETGEFEKLSKAIEKVLEEA